MPLSLAVLLAGLVIGFLLLLQKMHTRGRRVHTRSATEIASTKPWKKDVHRDEDVRKAPIRSSPAARSGRSASDFVSGGDFSSSLLDGGSGD